MATHLYAKHVFPHYGIPRKVISDRDPRFTGLFTTELSRKTGNQTKPQHSIPPSDGWPVRTIEPVAGTISKDIRRLHPKRLGGLAPTGPTRPQHVDERERTKQSPFNLLIGGLPTSHYPMTEPTMTDDKRMDRIHQNAIQSTREAITRKHKTLSRNRGNAERITNHLTSMTEYG